MQVKVILRRLRANIIAVEKQHVLYTERFIMFSVLTDTYNKKTKGPTLMELFTATGKLFFFYN
jgi:hypothetical protein